MCIRDSSFVDPQPDGFYRLHKTMREVLRTLYEWAMTQNNLGAVYSDLPTGDRAENVLHAIACYARRRCGC